MCMSISNMLLPFWDIPPLGARLTCTDTAIWSGWFRARFNTHIR